MGPVPTAGQALDLDEPRGLELGAALQARRRRPLQEAGPTGGGEAAVPPEGGIPEKLLLHFVWVCLRLLQSTSARWDQPEVPIETQC